MEAKHERRMGRAKRKHRPELGSWSEQGYHAQWPELKRALLQQFPHPKSTAPISRMSQMEFGLNKASFSKPCVVVDCTDQWPAKTKWRFDLLQRAHKRERVRCGEDDDGASVKVTVDTFVRYMHSQTDDSPLYVFDSHNARLFAGDYDVPEIFAQDLFQHAGERKRPPHRWFLLGPERSGSTIHIDPLQTAAWNALLVGRKLWAIFSPEVDKRVIRGSKYKLADDEAIDWFVHMMPHIVNRDLPGSAKFYYFVQSPGETVYVPSGWWHVVLNLDHTIAVTQNFCGDHNLDLVWRSTRVERRKLAKKWRRRLAKFAPEAHARIVQLDTRDGFDLDEEIARAKRRKKQSRKE